MTARYRPGTHPALVQAGVAVVTEADRLPELVALAGGEVTVLGVVQALSRGDLTGLPGFAILLVEGTSLRVVLRGEYDVRVGDRSWSGSGVATWSEQLVADGAGSEVSISATGSAATSAELPVTGGIVLVSSMTLATAPAQAGPEADRAGAASLAVVPALEVAPETEAQAEPQPAAQPEEAAQPEAQAEPEPQPEEAPQPEAQPEPEAEADPAPAPDPAPAVAEADNLTRAEPHDFDVTSGATVAGRRPRPSVGAPPPGVITGPPVASPATAHGIDAEPAQETAGEQPGDRAEEPVDDQLGDHDGRTVAASAIKRRKASAPVPAAPDAAPKAQLALSNGEVVDVERTVLIGRAPRVSQGGMDMPTIVVVDDPYVSGTHLEVAFQGRSLVATDRSTNGTLLTRPDRAPERLAKDVPTVLTSGSVLSLSDDLTALVTLEGTA